MNTVVKVCGLRLAEDAAKAAELGASFLGVVLAEDSPRCASLDQARAVRDAAGAATVVLVFRAAGCDQVLRASEALGVRTVQPHGMAEEDCRRLEEAGLQVIRVRPVAPNAGALPALQPEPRPGRLALLDVGRGGTGRTFRWSLLGGRGPACTLVAGGIRPDNVRALLAHRPWGIDVSSGVERSPGDKDHDKLQRLFAAVSQTEER